MPSALILMADGTEEMEFTIPYDTFVRAGISCTSAFVPAPDTDGSEPHAVSPPFCKGSRGINIQPDTYLEKHKCGPDHFDLLVIPGGAKGAETLSQSSVVQELVRDYLDHDKFVGMICAGSLAALTSKLPKQRLTSHPSVRTQLEKDFDYSEDSVVISGKLVTRCVLLNVMGGGKAYNNGLIAYVSRGPGTAFPFAFTLVELLCGIAKREEVRSPMVFPLSTPF